MSTPAPFIPKVYKQYRTEKYGPWHTRECYPWEYDVKAQECINTANQSVWSCFGPGPREDSEIQWFLQQTKIFQDRAIYIRQKWAEQEARQERSRQEALQIAKEVMQHVTQPPTPSTPQQVTQLATSSKKKHRNQKTRQQYKRKALQQANPEQCSMENFAEKPIFSSNSTVNTSQPFTASHQAVQHFDREPPHSSSKIHGCNSFRLRVLVKEPYYYIMLASLPGYMEYAKEMEAIGQG